MHNHVFGMKALPLSADQIKMAAYALNAAGNLQLSAYQRLEIDPKIHLVSQDLPENLVIAQHMHSILTHQADAALFIPVPVKNSSLISSAALLQQLQPIRYTTSEQKYVRTGLF